MTEPHAPLRLLLPGVPGFADRATVEVELVMLDEVVAFPTVNPTTGAADRFMPDPGKGPRSIIRRPCQELGVGDSSTGGVVDAFPVEAIPILVPALVKGMSTISLFAATAAMIRSIVSESDHSFQIL